MSQRRAYNREVVFHALHRGQIDTRLCTYLVIFSTLYPFLLSQIWGPSVLIPHPLFFQPILVFRLHHLPCPCQVNSCLFLLPHPHTFPLIPLRRLAEVHKRLRWNILRNHILTSPNVGFHRLKPQIRSRYLQQGVIPLSVQPLLWKPPHQSTHHLVLETPQYPWGVTTHVSAPNSNTDWKTALKKNSEIRGLAPSLLKILDILCQTVRAFTSFWTPDGQSSSAANSTIPRYLKDKTISRGIL